MLNQFAIAKYAVHAVAGLGVYKVANDFITNNTTVITKADRALVWAGRGVLGMMIAEQAGTFVDDRLNAVAAWWVERKEEAEDETPKK